MSEAPKQTERRPRTGDLIIPPQMQNDRVAKHKRVAKPPPKPAEWLAYLTIVLLTAAAYAPIFQSDLIWTTYDQVERSSFESMERFSQAWSLHSIRRDDPVTLSSYFLEQKLPLEPAITHHAINLLLHILAALIFLKVLDQLKMPAAFSASLVFALHPAAVQTVFWSGYRSELLCLILILTALFFGIRNRDMGDFLKFIAVSTVAFFLHPAALVLPLILGLCIFHQTRHSHLKDYNRLLPLVCLAVFIGVWTRGGAEGMDLELGERLGLYAQNFFFFLKQGLLPIELGLFHPFDQEKGFNVGAQNSLLPLALLLPFYILIAFNRHKEWARSALLGLTAYVLLIAYSVAQSGSFINGSPAYENNFQYVALPILIALIVCAAGGIARNLGAAGKVLWYPGFTIFVGIQIALTGSFAVAVSERTTLWNSISGQWPEASLPKIALIEAIQDEGGESELLSIQDMIEMLQTILDQNPDRTDKRILLSRIYRSEGENTNALREYKRVLRESEPGNEYLAEAVEFFDKLGLTWEANNTRERLNSNN